MTTLIKNSENAMNIIISGASRGIGREMAKQFAEKGHQVLAIARSSGLLEELKSASPNIDTLNLDLNDPKLGGIIKEKYSDTNGIDVLINNAGQLINESFLNTSAAQFMQQYQANVITAVNLIQASVAFLKKGAHLVNISSMGGFQGSDKFSGLSAYSSAKGALSILTECLAEEFKEMGVQVNALALGAVHTEMLKKAFPTYKAPLTSGEMAEYIVEFALNGNRFYNGKVLPVALGNP
jgi:NAD(P)-dependent dehydrogenase (short-subunit alcohol dehydrogenase family)